MPVTNPPKPAINSVSEKGAQGENQERVVYPNGPPYRE